MTRSSSSEVSLTARHGETRASQSASAFQTFPIPATSRWSSSVSNGAARLAAQVRNHRVQFRRLGEDVRPEPPDSAIVELEHRPVPEHGLALGAAQDEPRTSEQLRASRAHLPAARHAQMAAQDDTVLEAKDEVLSGRLDAEQPATVEALGEPLDRRPRVWRLDLDPLADEHL